jgi:hypothetical protein
VTPLASNDSTQTCRVRLASADHWVSLALSLADLAAENRFVTPSDTLSYEITGLDDVAQKFGLSNWVGGIISGARYAFRAMKAPLRQVRIHELCGQLGSGDVSAVSSAAALTVARLLGSPAAFPLDLAGWTVQEEVLRPPGAAGASPTGGVIPSLPESGHEAAEGPPRLT